MRIEKIERSKHKQERILVHLEGGDLLRIGEDELLRFGLYVGLDIDEQTVIELKKSAARSKTRTTAVRMVSSRPLSKKELGRRLREKGADEADAAAAADYLEQIGALDDAAYAAMLVRHYAARGYGKARVLDEFARRGVPRALWDEALEELPDAQTAVERILTAKLNGRTPEEKELQRLTNMLLRRGFSWREIKPAVGRLGITVENEEE